MNAKAILEGVKNFKNQTKEINDLAKKRYAECGCAETYLAVAVTLPKDETIPEISKKLCSECLCVLSFKLRQNIEKCKNWTE